jgi:hypothetical protein
MPDAKAIVVLTAGNEIQAQQSVEELTTLVSDSPRGEMSFMPVVDIRGQNHWINVREIVQIHEPPDYGSDTT